MSNVFELITVKEAPVATSNSIKCPFKYTLTNNGFGFYKYETSSEFSLLSSFKTWFEF